MNKITENQLFDLYKDTLEKCGLFLLNEDEEIIEYNIYEEFDIGIHSFFYSESLKSLFNANLISLKKFERSIILYDKFIELQKSSDWNIIFFKTSLKWREIMILCDELKLMN